ncbi:S-adenosyl-L-methionine-dependent methyltransferase [Mycena olivaceomarginata]|nr:S-adenosyl-L-methionine-dependent methyltransferase [Mycena olivaceomarginata]
MANAKTLEELSRADYWDERYRGDDSKDATFEWFKSFSNLESLFSKCLPKPAGAFPRILHLGCGNSVLCVDFSSVVIEDMAARFKDKGGISWKVEDVRQMSSIPDNDVDVAVDKGTLDAMLWGSLWDPPDEVKDNTRRYIDEVARALKPGGTFVYITYRQPHFIKPFLIREALWDLQVLELKEEAGVFEYFAFVMKKKAT